MHNSYVHNWHQHIKKDAPSKTYENWLHMGKLKGNLFIILRYSNRKCWYTGNGEKIIHRKVDITAQFDNYSVYIKPGTGSSSISALLMICLLNERVLNCWYSTWIDSSILVNLPSDGLSCQMIVFVQPRPNTEHPTLVSKNNLIEVPVSDEVSWNSMAPLKARSTLGALTSSH